MINTIQSAIKTLLLTIPDIRGVYEYPEGNPIGYPYMWITWDSNESDELTNQQDRITIKYKIVLVQEKIAELKGRQNAEITTKDRAWKIETLFRENNNLGLSSVLRVLPMESKKTYDSQATRIILETILKVEVVANVSI